MNLRTLSLSKKNIHLSYINSSSLKENKKNGIYDIDIDTNGNIYIPDFYNNKIIIYDFELNLKKLFKKIPMPHGICVDLNDNIYVTTYKNGRIKKYTKAGVEVKDWDQKFTKKGIIPVSIDTDELNNLYIADYGNKSIIKVNEKGTYINSFTNESITQKKIWPHGITIGCNECIYVADRMTKTICVFSLNGEYLKSWKRPDVNFDPLAIRFISEELLAVPDYSKSVIYIFDINGYKKFIIGEYGNKPGCFLFITNLVADKNGNIYFVEQRGNRIQRINLYD